MKKLLLISMIAFCGCASDFDRIQDAKKKYPNCIVMPSGKVLQDIGYEITVEDTINNLAYGIEYYTFSSTKIKDIRKIYKTYSIRP